MYMTMTLGEKISYLRQIKGLTQEELAIKSNISKNSIWNYENDKRIPTFKILCQIASGLGESVKVLTDDDELLKFSDNIINKIDKEMTEKYEQYKKNHNIFKKEISLFHDYSSNDLREISYKEALQSFQKILDYIKFNSNNSSLKTIGHDLEEEKPLFIKTIKDLELELIGILFNRGELISKNELIKGDDSNGNQEK